MLNKNDPLIGAVQQVMQQSNAEREATRLVNEAFGVEDRKALPHEYQAEWNSVYQQVLAEKAMGGMVAQQQAKQNQPQGVKNVIMHKRANIGMSGVTTDTSNQDVTTNQSLQRTPSGKNANTSDYQYMKTHGAKNLKEAPIDHPNKRKLDVAPPYGHLTKKDFSTLRAMGEEENFDKAKKMPLLIKKGQKPVQPQPMPNAPLKPKAGAYKLQKLEEDQLDEELLAIQEEIAYNLAEQAEYVYENYGEEGLVEFIDSLTEEQFELLSMHEGVWDYVKDRAGKAWDATKQAISEAVSPGAREPDAKTGSVGDTPWYRPIQGARKDNYADRMNQNTRLNIAKQKGTTDKLTGDDAWQNRIRDPKVQQQVNWPDGKVPGGQPKVSTQMGSDPTNTDSGQRAGAAQPTPKPPKPKVKPADLNTTPKVKKKSAPKAAAPKASAPKAAAQPKKKLTFFQKQELRRSAKNDTIDQTRNLERRYGVRAPMKKAKRSVFGEQIRDIIAQRIDEIYVDPKADTPAGRAYKQTLDKKGAGAPLQAGQKWNAPNRSMGSDPTNTAKGTRAAAGPKAAPALDPTRNVSLDQPATKSPMAAALNRQDLAKSVQAGRVGDPGKQNFIQNARAQKEREKAAGGDGSKYLPFSPAVQQAVKDNQPQPGRPQTLSPGANPPVVSKNMGGGAGDYRRAQASPIKVSDTEVMNDPKFKKALTSVGGTQAAKKIQTGERVAGLGRMNKGDTIMSRVRTDIAARKNVGRES